MNFKKEFNKRARENIWNKHNQRFIKFFNYAYRSLSKLSVQKLLFPSCIVINPEDRTYRTSNLNPIFGLIHSFTGLEVAELKEEDMQ
jgi:hypothetical protein|tara:strand:+ start:847 stop:1107 length:261 start_codon:yes stop_codon:yes gene_type:complete